MGHLYVQEGGTRKLTTMGAAQENATAQIRENALHTLLQK